MSAIINTTPNRETYLELVHNSQFSAEVTVTSGSLPLTLVNGTLYFTVKEHWDDDDDDAVFQIAQASHVDAAGGLSTLDIPAEDTKLCTVGKEYYFDYQLVYSSAPSEPTVIMRGIIKFLYSVRKGS